MRQITFLFALMAACSSVPKDYDDDYDSSQQEFNSNPPPPKFVCDYPLAICDRPKCVNLQWDNNNCGVCGNECERGAGEVCFDFQCRPLENFGFDSNVVKRGPVEYVPRRDLPRPTPTTSEDEK